VEAGLQEEWPTIYGENIEEDLRMLRGEWRKY